MIDNTWVCHRCGASWKDNERQEKECDCAHAHKVLVTSSFIVKAADEENLGDDDPNDDLEPLTRPPKFRPVAQLQKTNLELMRQNSRLKEHNEQLRQELSCTKANAEKQARQRAYMDLDTEYGRVNGAIPDEWELNNGLTLSFEPRHDPGTWQLHHTEDSTIITPDIAKAILQDYREVKSVD